MKLVIEISEEFYNGLMDESYDSVRSIPLEYTILVHKIENGKPLDDVLDEIKKEFNGLVWEEAIEIIDKYRGEQK